MNAPGARRQFARLALTLAVGLLLLCAQLLAIHHGLSHAVHATQAHATGAPHHPVSERCHGCDGLIAFEAMLPSVAVVLPTQALFAHAQPTARMPAAPVAATPPVYRSRAPPPEA